LSQEASEPEAARLMRSTFVLSGLRFGKEMTDQLKLGVQAMNLGIPARILKDSTTYQWLEETLRPEVEKKIRAEVENQIRVQEARSLLVILGTRRFGEPTEAQKARLDRIADHDRLVQLCESVTTPLASV
jgi:hypothetical protein